MEVEGKPRNKMKDVTFHRPRTPTFSQNPFSFITYSWMWSTLRKGYGQPLEHEELPVLPPRLFTKEIHPPFEQRWEANLARLAKDEKGRHTLARAGAGKNAQPLARVLFPLHGLALAWSLGFTLLQAFFQFWGPIFLGRITSFLQNPRATKGDETKAYVYAVLMFLAPLAGALCTVLSARVAIGTTIRIRAELTAAVYRKALRLSSRAKQTTEVGRIVNLMSNDVNTIMTFFYPFFSQLFSAPAIIIAALVLLWFQISWATFIGLAILLMSTPATSLFVKRITQYRKEMLKCTDSRVKLMNQLLSGIRVLKIYAWEAAQQAAVMEARQAELRQLGRAVPHRVGMQVLMFSAPVLAAVVSFAVYGAVEPERFTAPRIFSAIAYFSLMRMPLVFLPFAIVTAGNAFVSMRRLSQFLTMEERNPDAVTRLETVGARIVNANFYWAESVKAKVEDKGKKGKRGRRGKEAARVVDQVVGKDAQQTGALREQVGDAASGPGKAANADTTYQDIVALDTAELERGTPGDTLARTGEEAARGGGGDVAKLSTDSSASTSSSSGAPSAHDSATTAAEAGARGGKAAAAGGAAGVAEAAPEGAPAEATWWLRDVDIEVKPGQLVCIVGRVGSGKTSLVSALLGEMEKHSGQVALGGRVAYVAQQAWIVNDSLKNNVTLGQEFDEARWQAAVYACSLEADLEVLPAGAETEIGEKGINLSGGQKQRISLARATYADADLYIMDDPLSAVDVHVGRHIFDECISGALAKKTRVLVTNQLQYTPAADHIIYVHDGRVAAQGTFDEVSKHEGFYSLLNEFNSRADQPQGGADASSPVVDVLLPAESAHASPPVSLRRISRDQIRQSLEGQAARLGSRHDSLPLDAVTLVERRASVETIQLPRRASGGGSESRMRAPSPGDLPHVPLPPQQQQAAASIGGNVNSASNGNTVSLPRSPFEAPGAAPVAALAAFATPAERAAGAVRPSDLAGSTGLVGTAASGELSRGGSIYRSRSQISRRSSASGEVTAPVSFLHQKSRKYQIDKAVSDAAAQLSGSDTEGEPGDEEAAPGKAGGGVSTRRSGSGSGSRPKRGSKSGSKQKAALKGAAVQNRALAKLGSLIVREDRVKGAVEAGVYRDYARAYGWAALGALACCWAGEQTFRILTNWWLSQWVEREVLYRINLSLGRPASDPRLRYIGGYVGFTLAFVVLTLCRSTINLLSGLRASRGIHHASLAALVRAPISFFDTTPIGRILNRFAKDTDDMDYLLPQSVTEFGNCLMQLAATLVFISVIQPWFLLGMLPLMVVYYGLQRFYRRSYVELQRIDAVTRSPIYAHFSETLSGTDTIRAYGYAARFEALSDTKVDYNHLAYWALQGASQWLGLRLDMIGACLIFLVAILAIANRGTLSPALAALSLSEVLDVTGFLKYAVQAAAMFESRFNSVERITAYEKLPSEAPRHIAGKEAPPSWPDKGVIAYRDVWMRYREGLDPVLQGISFEVAAGEKVGIVGRTGSGKSSLIVTLFRIVEPFAGAITLDGRNILDMGLDDVRSRIAAIPQDPVLFSGTVRTNLDPYDRHSDADLWEALGMVALKVVVGGLAGGLGARVAEGGDNFSVGQRQLLCVARALLRKPRVLVADEATASVDGETDALIQRTIRAAFADCTVLTIAHRLNTILDATKVLVMEAGKVKEFDSVPTLLARPGGTFRAMVEDAGLAPRQAPIAEEGQDGAQP